MVFQSQNQMLFQYVLLIGILCLLIIVFLAIIRKRPGKKFMISVCVLLVVMVAICAGNYYQHGVKKIVFPLLDGNNEYTTTAKVKQQIRLLNSMDLQQVKYKEKYDPSQASGNRDCFEVVFCNGTKETYVSDGEYMLLIREDKKQLYRIGTKE